MVERGIQGEDDGFTIIPDAVLEDGSLSPTEILLFCRISKMGKCWASNAWFASKMNKSETWVSKSINSLIKKGYVEHVGFTGRFRVIRAIKDLNSSPMVEQEFKAWLNKSSRQGRTRVQPESTDNNNKENTTIQSSSKELDVAHLWICTLFSKNTNKYKLTPKRKQKLRLRLKELGNQGIKDAYNNIFMSNFHRGDNDRGWKIDDDPYWLLENAERAEKWANKETVETIDGIPTNIDLSKAGVR